MSLIDADLLQLIGHGSTGDPDLPDGRHLRWIFHRILGFPRTGFRLRRRPSLLGLDFEKQVPQVVTVRSQLTRRVELGTGQRRRFPNGLTVSKAGGFVFGPAISGGEPVLRVDARPVHLDFRVEGTAPPASGETLSNPAAYVLLTITRRRWSGHVVARGYHDGRPELRLVDRAAVGSNLPIHVAELGSEIRTVGSVDRVLSFGERLIGPEGVVLRDSSAVAAVARDGLRPWWPRPPRIPDLNPYVTETLLLHGGLLERVVLVGHDANLVRVQWVTTRDWMTSPGWTDLDTFRLPLTDAPEIYPAWSGIAGEQIASTRLHLAPPKRQAPWDREDGGRPPILLDTVAQPVTDSLDARYLGPEFEPVDSAMRDLLTGELVQIVPQALVQVTERLEPEAGDTGGPGPVDVTVSPFDLLYGASADPQVARLLGLSTVDVDDPGGIYDYAVEAGFAFLWLQWLLLPFDGRRRSDEFRQGLGGERADWEDRGPFRPVWVGSLLTGLARAPAVALEPPQDLRAEVIPDPTSTPVQARVRVHWQRGAANLFEEPRGAQILHAFKRVQGTREMLLHHRDDDTRLLAPHLPTPYGEPEPRRNLVDRELPDYGPHTWRVVGMDLFGRVSPDATVSATVRDTIPPPPPINLEAVLHGDATTGPDWTHLTVGFDWTPAQEAVAPDLAGFELHLHQGALSSADASQPGTWGQLETTPSAIAGPARIAWPSLVRSNLPPGVTVDASAAPLAGGGQRITLQISPIDCPFDPGGTAHLAAAIRAVDVSDNAGVFAVARSERVDLHVPPPPDFSELAQRATPPDAQNRSWYSVPVPEYPGASVRVLRASSVALLAAAGTAPAAFEALGEAAQVGFLKQAAVSHRQPFATDHEQPVPAIGAGYPLELVGSDKGFTVVHVAVENRNGAQSPWPTDPSAFLVVLVPQGAQPPAPLVSEVRVGDGSVTLTVAPDITNRTAALAVYRARTADEADDVRRMRPVATVAIPQPSAAAAQVVDTGLYDDVEYLYRVVAIGQGGVRSRPSVIVPATPRSSGPPPAPQVVAVERMPADPARRRVQVIVPRRDYRVLVLRRRQFAAAWEALDISTVQDDGSLDFAALATVSDPAGYRVTVVDTVPAPDAAYAYLARIEDPRGRAATGEPVLESP